MGHVFRLATGCLLLLITAGCGETVVERELAEVKGTVTYNGNVLKKGTVTFQPASGAGAAAEIQPDGNFTLQAVVGPNTVMVVNREPDPGPGGAAPEERAKAMAAQTAVDPATIVPDNYSTPASPLKYEVKAGPNTANLTIP
ncbi:MAG: hypothetical protein WEB58_13180 [Planctomycetaceae bacterium]